MNIKELYEQYVNVDIGDLSNNQKRSIKEALKLFCPEDLRTIEEHKMFIEILKIFRMSSFEDMRLVGDGFVKTLESLLSVGEDGIYSNSQRFIYELIQNVDDCEYDKIEECNLDIKFLYDKNPGRIVFEYNEKGFTPQNVVGITGIAEKVKNVSPDKIEIGEKGIGFKSVFGISDKVHIESGYFSFELYKNNFTVPIPKYDNFEPVKGTRLTLEMDAFSVKKLFRSLVDVYAKKDAGLNQNPILFLNKLTHLKMYHDDFRCIEFNVERTEPEMIGDIAYEGDVSVSVKIRDYYNGTDNPNNNEKNIKCKRYTVPIVYGKKECVSRYGEDVAFSERRHRLIALFPILNSAEKNYKGIMYSFLPTQIKMTVPLLLHVPFKLDGSRQFVDSQDNNEWFRFTIENLKNFLYKIYVHLAVEVKQGIISYIPRKREYLFEDNNEKVKCLLNDAFKGTEICKQKIFYTNNGLFESAENVVSFDVEENIKNPAEVYTLLGKKTELFIPQYSIDMQAFNVKTISNVPKLLLKNGLKDDTIFDDIAKILDDIGNELDFEKLIEECCPMQLTRKQLLVISAHKRLYKAIKDYGKRSLEINKLPEISFADDIKVLSEKASNELKELIDSFDIGEKLVKYLDAVNYNFFAINGIDNEFALLGKEGIVFSDSCTFGSFGEILNNNNQKVYLATLQLRQASENLNNVDESMSNIEFLKLLRSVRISAINAFNRKNYDNYITLINQSGTNKGRFLHELIQNADDCEYPSGILPTFELNLKKDEIIVTYNESGFTKQNVRAITAIGESTKNLLINGEENKIGEKGVGFKSVFRVAEYVEIHSNGFDFKLQDKNPTVPQKCKTSVYNQSSGTTLVFKMKENMLNELRDENIIPLCICLRKIKKISINGRVVEIEDTEKERIVNIGGRRYHFDRVEYQFDITEEKAIKERSGGYKSISQQQRIRCYIPMEYKAEKYYLYTGLPTDVVSNVPLIIDAPFELNTSRDNVLENCWNEKVRDGVYEAILKVMDVQKEAIRIDVLKYVGFSPKSKQNKYENFSNSFLNKFNWNLKLKTNKILPLLESEGFVSVNKGKCIIIPDVIACLSDRLDIKKYYGGEIIDTYKKSQYNSLLEELGCRESDVIEDLKCIIDVADVLVKNSEARNMLYAYLKSKRNMIMEQELYEKVKQLPIFPVKTKNGVEYVPYSKNIYTHDYKVSDNEFKILDTSIMGYERACEILSSEDRINKLTDEVYENKYWDYLINYIKSESQVEKTAIYLLNEFKNNYSMFAKRDYSLRGMKKEIPMEFLTGGYRKGNAFINRKGVILSGDFIKGLVVTDAFTKFAEFLECKDILEIHYDDIDVPLNTISDADIDDFQKEFSFGREILSGLIDDGIITDEQIERFNLQYLIHESEIYDENEDFPGRAVADLQRLRARIINSFNYNPNPYITKNIKINEPKKPIDNKAYTIDMYGSENNRNKCFCQMCQKLIDKKYIERNDVQKQPKYGWNQMYLSLCVMCSKDYILLRNNDTVWKKFIESILEADVEDEEIVKIPIGDKEIAFTATHLAEIQAILEVEENNKKSI